MSDVIAVYPVEPLEMRVYQAVSGQKIECKGQPAQLKIADGVVPAIVLSRKLVLPGGEYAAKGDVLVLDPRVMITTMAGGVLFNCRDYKDAPIWVREWLTKHPEWPGVLEL